MRNILSKLPMALIALAMVFGVFAPNAAHADEIPNKEVTKEAFQKIVGMGATPEAAAATLGNAYKESTLNPSATQASSIKAFIEKGNLCNPSGIGGGAAAGFFQWDGSRRDAMLCHTEKKGLEWDSLDSQLEYAFITEMKISDPFKEAAYGARAKTEYCPGSGADCSKVRTSLSGVEEYFQGTDVAAATIEFVGYWERPGQPDSKTRVDMALKIYEEFKDLPGIDLGESVGNGSNDNEGGQDDKKESTDSGGIPEEGDLTGMPDRMDWDEGSAPEDATAEDLKIGEQYQVASLRSDIALQQEGAVHTAQVGISLMGMLIMIWGVLLFACMLLDKSNSFFEFQAVKAITFNKIQYAENPEDKSKTALLGRQIAVRSLLTILIGLVFVSGTFYGWTLDVLMFIKEK